MSRLNVESASRYGVNDWWMSKKKRRKETKKYRVYKQSGIKKELIGKFGGDEIKKEGFPEPGVYGTVVEEEKDINKVLVIDTSLGLEHARGIGKDDYEVYYAVVHSSPYPKMQDEITGFGFPEIHKVWDWGEGLEEGCGVVVFTDIGFGKVADFLRKKGYYVFGTDSRSERLETDRIYMRSVMRKLQIPIPRGKVIRGVERLLNFIDKTDEKYFVKVNFVRGDFETMATDDKAELMVALSKGAFTILGDEVNFVVEEPCEGVEIGIDAFFNGEEFLSPVFETYEVKNIGNITKTVEYEESIWKEVLDKITPYLEKNRYHGMLGVEGFFNGKEINVIDYSMRYGFICSHAYPVMIENYGDVVTAVAAGENIDIDVKSKYSVQVGVYTDNIEVWRIIRYSEGNWEIGFRKAILKGDKVWFVPGDGVVAVSVGCGNTLDEAMDSAVAGAESVEFKESYTQGEELRKYVKSFLEKAAELGYDF